MKGQKKGTEIMDLHQLLVQPGICSADKLAGIRIKALSSNGMRQAGAANKRFLISLDGKKLCSIKQLPAQGFYSLKDIAETQRLFRSFADFSAPAIFCVIDEAGPYAYIVEEYISAAMTLDEAVCNSQISLEEASGIMDSLFAEIAGQEGELRDQHLLVDEQETIAAAIKWLSLSPERQQQLREVVRTAFPLLAGQAVFSSGDLLPQNILLTDDKPVVVDFDLSRQTHFLWLDVLRCQFYTSLTLKEDLLPRLPDQVHPLVPKIIFLLREIHLQQAVVDPELFNRILPSLEFEILSLLEKVEEK